jgi:phosphatidate cytidylyltransferase
MLRAGLDKWQSISSWVRLFIGVLMLSVTWLALLQAKIMGSVFLLSILSLVWIADIAAYFAGRTWGRHKLAPSISPGKSWEGVLGGMVAVLVWSFAWLALEDMNPLFSGSIYGKLMMHGWAVMVFGVIFLTLTSVMGDLIESLVKRSAGAKDSSGLLPGHGGVLDRLDALLPTLPISIMLCLV